MYHNSVKEIFIITAIYITSIVGYVLVAIAMVGKLAITVVFSFDYFWSSEVFPTTLRATLVGLCSLFARIGVILSPIIVDLVITFGLIIPTIHV